MRFLLVFLLFSSVYAKQSFHLKAKLQTLALQHEVLPLLTKDEKVGQIEQFQKEIKALSKGEQEQILKFIKVFDPHVPEKILKGMAYYRYVIKDPLLLEKVLTYHMISKSMVIRDWALESHEQGQLDQRVSALQNFTEHKKVTPYNLEELMLPLYAEKARFLANMKEDSLFIEALKTTPLMTSKLYKIIGSHQPVHLDVFGPIPGNTISQVSSLKEEIKKAKETLWIDPLFAGLLKEDKDLLAWVKNHPNPKFTLFFELEDGEQEKWKSLSQLLPHKLKVVVTNRLKGQQRKNSQFHAYLNRSETIIVDGLKEDGFVLYNREQTMKVEGPLPTVLQTVFFEEMTRYSDEKVAQEIPELIPFEEGTFMRMGYNDGVERNNTIRDTLIGSLLEAQKSILADQSFLYDPYVVDTLIKVKIKNPNLKVQILLDMTSSFELNGLPNTMFIEELKKHGVEMRTRKLGSPQINMIAIDSEKVIWGSTTITPDSMEGYHKEVLFTANSPELAEIFEDKFKDIWKDPKLALNLDIEHFRVTIEGKRLRSPSSQIINDIGAKLLKNKSFLIH